MATEAANKVKENFLPKVKESLAKKLLYMYYKYIQDFSIIPVCYGDLFIGSDFLATQAEIEKLLSKGGRDG